MKNKDKKHKASTPHHLNVSMEELLAMVERTKRTISTEDHEMLSAVISTLAVLMEEVKRKNGSISRLQQILFGSSTEKTSKILGGKQKKKSTEPDADNADPKPKKPGHGRKSAAAYVGAERKFVAHASLSTGQCCPECITGKVYPLSEPKKLVRITGMAPLGATVWSCERLRCNLCGEVYTAEAPEGVGDKKYDETSTAMIGMLKYGCGLPFNRIQKLQAGLGIPLPASCQWGLVKKGAELLAPVFNELVHQAAQGEVIHNDDTTARILGITKKELESVSADKETEDRKGIFTTGIISKCGKETIALFFTGARHAGENLAVVLAKRASELSKPIQMCDGHSANTAKNFEVLLSNCNAHARRRFVELIDDFPDECRIILETFSAIYRNDSQAKTDRLSPQQRLEFHQTHSAPIMDRLEIWMAQQFEQRLVEPNSRLGEAIIYAQKRWSKLTLFLREPGAPLDNNVCERALKKAILHRKNALFYKTKYGARVGDIFMSLIHTSELSGVDVFDYLVTLMRRHKEAQDNPAAWMPWNYSQAKATSPPS
jgi:hypothetical protein